MKGRNQVGVFALVLAACLYLIGAFWFWSLDPEDWHISFRAIVSFVWICWVSLLSAFSIFESKDW